MITRVTPQDTLPDLLNYALVAPRIKVLYVPTTKVACSSLKLLVSQVEGSYDAHAAEEIITAIDADGNETILSDDVIVAEFDED